MRDFLFAHTRVWTGDLWISSPALYHCATWVTIWFSPLTISGIELWCRGIGGGIVLIGPVRDFLFAHTRVWTGDLWISSPALYHWCAIVLIGHIFFLPTPGFDLGTSGSLLLHSTTVTSSGFHLWIISCVKIWYRGIGDGIVLIGPVRDFLFAHTRVWTGDLWISSPALYHWWQDDYCFSLLTISGIEVWCRDIAGGIVLIRPVRDIHFAPSRVSTGDLWISSPALYPCATATWTFSDI